MRSMPPQEGCYVPGDFHRNRIRKYTLVRNNAGYLRKSSIGGTDASDCSDGDVDSISRGLLFFGARENFGAVLRGDLF